MLEILRPSGFGQGISSYPYFGYRDTLLEIDFLA